MTDETGQTEADFYQYDSTDDSVEGKAIGLPPALARFLVQLGTLALAAAAGWMFAMIGERILERFSE